MCRRSEVPRVRRHDSHDRAGYSSAGYVRVLLGERPAAPSVDAGPTSSQHMRLDRPRHRDVRTA
eukprot:6888543-Pyramimonas_sp.AAC.1